VEELVDAAPDVLVEHVRSSSSPAVLQNNVMTIASLVFVRRHRAIEANAVNTDDVVSLDP